MKIRPGSTPARRRRLRRDQTDAERRLWYHLGSRQLEGFKFRRQHSIGRYILDFYCPEVHLAVELDGEQHAETRQQAYDEARTAELEAHGVRIRRFSDREVLTAPTSVLSAIWAALTLPSPTAVGEG